MQNSENPRVRAAIIRAGIEYRQLAASLGMAPTSLSRLLSKPLKEEKEAEIMETIADMVKPLKDSYKSRLEILLDIKGITRSRACKILHISRAELDQIVDDPQPEQRELLTYFCRVISHE